MAKEKKDPYALVQQSMIKALEEGVVPWHKPWAVNGGLARSMSSRKPYRGGNVLVLLATSMYRGFASPWWGTWTRIKNLGGAVKDDEKKMYTSVVAYRPYKDKDEDGNEVTRMYLGWFNVYNLDQTVGLEEKFPVELVRRPEDFKPNEEAERLIKLYKDKPPINYGSNRAAYSPSLDRIVMPNKANFFTDGGFYSTLWHELGHSTGHESRLDRKAGMTSLKGDHNYSFEELVAEFTAALMCAVCGLDPSELQRELDQSASYIDGWLHGLSGEDNKTWVVKAGTKAQKAVEYMIGADNFTDGTLEVTND